MTTGTAVQEELPCGLASTVRAAGFTEVSRPTRRRVVVAIDLIGTTVPAGGAPGRTAP